MVTDINLQKSCSKSNWYSGKYKLGFFDSLTKNSLTEFSWGVLKICHVFVDSIILNNRSIVRF